MKLNDALIGYTGFIGSNLLKFSKDIKKYNSRNINEIKFNSFNNVICAGNYSKIWLANKNKREDYKNIQNLINSLKTIKANNFILISSCEVYGNYFYNTKIDCNENKRIINKRLSNYGQNRLFLEKFIIKKFNNYNIIRLPIVYGKGFSKNFIFDLIHNKNIEKINGSDVVQIYNVKNLSTDIKKIIKKKIKIINLSSPPIKVEKIANHFFNHIIKNNEPHRIINMKSIYANKNGYYFSYKKCFEDLKKFLKYYI